MGKIAKRTGIGAFLLMIIPILAWASCWKWQPEQNYLWLQGLYWLTKNISPIWSIVSSAGLLSWFLWCLRLRLKPALCLTLILTASFIIGQGVKLVIKNQLQAPRPFVLWFNNHDYINHGAFCTCPDSASMAFLEKKLKNSSTIPIWIKNHWYYDTTYSFPSGHTIFSSSWGLLSIGLLWPCRYMFSSVLIMLWAILIMVTRMVLGLHFPQDLIMGVVISWLVIMLTCWLVHRWIITPDQKNN